MMTPMTERRFAAIAFICWIAITALVTAHHEPWRDEADPWLIARDNGLAGIVSLARHVGVPAMWYLAVAPLPRLGAPYAAQNALNLLFAAGAVALLLFRSPFSRTTKVLLAFSYYLGYEYASIARPYALSLLLLFAAASMFEKPLAFAVLIALAMNVVAHASVIAGAMAVAWWIRRPEGRRYAWIVAAGTVVAALQMMAPADAQRVHAFAVTNWPALPFMLGHAFLPTIPMSVGAPAAIAVLAAISYALRHSREALVAMWVSIAGLAFVGVFVWTAGLRHAGFVLIAVVVAMWIGRRSSVVLNATLVVALAVGAGSWYDEWTAAFSGSREMARVLRQYGDYEIAAHNLTQCEAILPYLEGRRFWYAGLGAYGTHMRWDAAQERAVDVSYPEAEARARAHFAGKRWLLLLNVEMPDPRAHGFRLIARTREPVFEKSDERYWLYEPL
jgi:hypothetical protein